MPDHLLVERAKADPEVFGLLMGRYAAALLRYVRRLGVSTVEEAEDIVQDTFIRAYSNLNEYDESLKFSSWLYRIAHNRTIDLFRRENARPRTQTLDEGEWQRLVVPTSDIERELLNRECLNRVGACIGTLPIQYRDALVLRFLEEKSYEEIMDILKKPKGSVATLISRGRKLLIECLGEDGMECAI